ALLSKPMAVSLPVVLVLLDIYPLKRLGFAPTSWITPAGRRAWLEKVPFILPAAATSAVTLVRVGQITDLTTLPSVGWLGRLAISLYALAFYLWKTLVPRNLSPLYEQPVPLDPIAWPFLVSAAAVLAVAIAALAFRRRWPALPVVGAAYVVVLLPVLGIVQVQTLIAGDRYTYLACLGWALLAGGLLTSAVEAHAAGRLGRDPMAAIALLALALPIVLGALTWTQTRVWRDSETLWARALAVTPSPRAHLHLGTTLVREGRPAEAIPHLRETLRLQPDYADAHLELGIALAAQGNLSPAIEHYREALRLSPRETLAYYNLGVALVRLGKPAEAIQHYEEALRLYPAYADARINLGIALLQANRPADAIAHFRTALDSDPRNAQVHNLLGIALAQAGRLREAAEHFREALRLHPEFEQARANLAQVLDVERRQLQ
ncbi:MAG TPA: tetratricopeptide repeat protein, partial [Chloroflexota bacterium]|nr:tetratricopeptide repeat protein [Chloroflexota bacterium]